MGLCRYNLGNKQVGRLSIRYNLVTSLYKQHAPLLSWATIYLPSVLTLAQVPKSLRKNYHSRVASIEMCVRIHGYSMHTYMCAGAGSLGMCACELVYDMSMFRRFAGCASSSTVPRSSALQTGTSLHRSANLHSCAHACPSVRPSIFVCTPPSVFFRPPAAVHPTACLSVRHVRPSHLPVTSRHVASRPSFHSVLVCTCRSPAACTSGHCRQQLLRPLTCWRDG